ncbi:GNAT family N-acetyltransferase [Halalkalibacillus halophilus]|uniref:GNAT family N-acetyltransferase n=1 Tax=Halalkalibacillus halophilus TaxID=392827 RepID=UPI0003FEFD02|nr:GNAT family N-acetyltransferase [Halalkalibacillus halophilus]
MIFRHVEKRDLPQLHELFQETISTVVEVEGLADVVSTNDEVQRLMQVVEDSFNKDQTYFFVAEEQDELLGTIAITPPGEIIRNHCPELSEVLEIGCVYIKVSNQSQGVGRFLLTNIFDEARKLNMTKSSLDAGFKSSQAYWMKKLGDPIHVVKDCWGKGADHMVWEIDLIRK